MTQQERDQYIEKNSYPEKPVIEQPSWRPHYHRKKGPNKFGVANRNERVRNPGPGGPKKNGKPSKNDQHHNGGGHTGHNGGGNKAAVHHGHKGGEADKDGFKTV